MLTLFLLTTCPEAHAVGSRSHAGLPSKVAGKVALIVEAGFVGDRSDLVIGSGEELTGFLNSHGMQEAGGGHAEEILKASIEMSGGETDQLGHRFHGDVFGVVILEMADDWREGPKTFFGFVGSGHRITNARNSHHLPGPVAKRHLA